MKIIIITKNNMDSRIINTVLQSHTDVFFNSLRANVPIHRRREFGTTRGRPDSVYKYVRHEKSYCCDCKISRRDGNCAGRARRVVMVDGDTQW